MTLQARFIYGVGDWLSAMKEVNVPVEAAALAAIREVGDKAKLNARAEIARAGFSQQWQNAFRVVIYEPGKVKRQGEYAAAWCYHAIPYAGVFENGATIRGSPNLWVPLPWAPKKIGRLRMTPENYIAATNNKLFPIRRGGKTYLAASLQMSGAAARKDKIKVSATALRRGRTGRGDGSVLRSVPLFVSVNSVQIKKRLNVHAAVQRAADQLVEAYFRNFKGD